MSQPLTQPNELSPLPPPLTEDQRAHVENRLLQIGGSLEQLAGAITRLPTSLRMRTLEEQMARPPYSRPAEAKAIAASLMPTLILLAAQPATENAAPVTETATPPTETAAPTPPEPVREAGPAEPQPALQKPAPAVPLSPAPTQPAAPPPEPTKTHSKSTEIHSKRSRYVKATKAQCVCGRVGTPKAVEKHALGCLDYKKTYRADKSDPRLDLKANYERANTSEALEEAEFQKLEAREERRLAYRAQNAKALDMASERFQGGTSFHSTAGAETRVETPSSGVLRSRPASQATGEHALEALTRMATPLDPDPDPDEPTQLSDLQITPDKIAADKVQAANLTSSDSL